MPHTPRTLAVLACVLVAVCAARHLYRSPWSASSLDVAPDSVEYASMARRIAVAGQPDIRVGGRARPARYAPWFAAVLAPAYAAAPSEPGAGIVPVLLLACLGVTAAYLLGRQAAGDAGGILAAVFLVHHRTFHGMARLVMTDAPALSLALCVAWISVRSRRRPTHRDLAATGALLAIAAAFRPEYAVFLLPAALPALNRENRIRSGLVTLFAPIALVAAATAAYNHFTFGPMMRTGYHYWSAVPYDYPSLLFHPRYIGMNLSLIGNRWVYLTLAAGAAGLCVLRLRRAPAALPLAQFTLLGALPISIAHLLYYYPEYRFHLPLLGLCCIEAGAGAAAIVPDRFRRAPWLIAVLVAFGALTSWPSEDPVPQRRLSAEGIARSLPADAVLVSNESEVFLDGLVLAGTRRQYIPLSHATPYADTLVAPRRVRHPVPAPTSATDYRCAGLARGGAEEAFRFTALTAPGSLRRWMAAGRKVYLDTSSLPPGGNDERTLARWFRLERDPKCPWLSRLLPRPASQGR